MEFKKFNKISRYDTQKICVTEKIDGTNGVIYVDTKHNIVKVGSRSRWIYMNDDNYGFAAWADSNKYELLKLGSGYHYGEWWGQGIQRNYGMKQKVFSLFNATKWTDNPNLPKCCDVVPKVFEGTHEDFMSYDDKGCFLEMCCKDGFPSLYSKAAHNYNIKYDRPEGLMIYFIGTGNYMKLIWDK